MKDISSEISKFVLWKANQRKTDAISNSSFLTFSGFSTIFMKLIRSWSQLGTAFGYRSTEMQYEVGLTKRGLLFFYACKTGEEARTVPAVPCYFGTFALLLWSPILNARLLGPRMPYCREVTDNWKSSPPFCP